MGLVCGVASTAHAHERGSEGLTLGLEVGPNFVVVDGDRLDESAGVGVNGRIGYTLSRGLLFLTPEAKFGFESPGTPNALRILGGARAGLTTFIAPVAFAHAGGLVGDLDGFAWDVGGGLDINFGSLAVGLTVSYNRAEAQNDVVPGVEDSKAFEWVQVGAGITLVL